MQPNPGVTAKRIGITGSPATGKKSVGRELALLLGYQFLNINDVAMDHKTGDWVTMVGQREFEVNPRQLKKTLVIPERTIAVGHLLAYVARASQFDFIAVLRCDPRVLVRRYRARRYPASKIHENLEAESLDIVSYETLRAFGRRLISEFDSSHDSPASLAKQIAETARGNASRSYGICAWRFKHAISEATPKLNG